MRAFVFTLSIFFLFTQLHAETPFTLTGVKKLSVLVEDYSGLKLKETLITKMKKMMTKDLKKSGVIIEEFNNNVLALMIKSQKFGTIQSITLDLILAGQVRREGEKDLVFGLTYQHSDTVEVEDLESDIIDSLEFLLSEFSDQYIEDQKE